MKVEQLIPVKRIRKSLPKTVESFRSSVVDRFQTVARSDAVAKARKAVRRGSEETMKWAKRNPRAMSLAGLGLGGALATWMLVRARRKPSSKLMQRAMKAAGGLPGFKKGLVSTAARFIGWALTPRKPHVFRAISVRW